MNLVSVSTVSATWFGLAAAIVGGYATYNQYAQQVEKSVDDRAQLAISFVHRFSSAEMLPIRNKIYNAIFTGDKNAISVSNTDTFAFVEFFDTVGMCVERNLCDKDIIADVFKGYATFHWPCLKPFIMSVRRSEEGFKLRRQFGSGMEEMAGKVGSAAYCKNIDAAEH